MQWSPPQAGAQIGHLLHRDHRDPIVEMVRPGSGIDDPEVFELEIMEGHTHRARGPGGVGNLEFEPVPASSFEGQQIQLSPAVRRPEIRISRPQSLDHLLEGESLP